MGEAFQKKVGGAKCLISWMFCYVDAHKNMNLNAKISINMTVLHRKGDTLPF